VKRAVTVEVSGQKFSLRTDADEAYVKSLARFVTEKIDEARGGKGGRTVATQSLAILAAMNIADDLFQARKADRDLRKQVKEKSKTILELLRKEANL
jgi:cell division protein ZapA (FtsZ GTPase activity inhibitor)